MEYIGGLRKILKKKKNQPPSICGEHRGDLEKFLRKKLATVNMWSTQDLEKFLSSCNGRRKTSHKKLSTLLHKPSLHKVQVSSEKAETAKNGHSYLCGERKSSIVVVQCSDSAAFGYYTVRCGATSVMKMVLGSEFLTVLQRLQEPATSAWR